MAPEAADAPHAWTNSGSNDQDPKQQQHKGGWSSSVPGSGAGDSGQRGSGGLLWSPEVAAAMGYGKR